MKVLTLAKKTRKPQWNNTILIWDKEAEEIIRGSHTHVVAVENNGTLIHPSVDISIYQDIIVKGLCAHNETSAFGFNEGFYIIKKETVLNLQNVKDN